MILYVFAIIFVILILIACSVTLGTVISNKTDITKVWPLIIHIIACTIFLVVMSEPWQDLHSVHPPAWVFQ